MNINDAVEIVRDTKARLASKVGLKYSPSVILECLIYPQVFEAYYGRHWGGIHASEINGEMLEIILWCKQAVGHQATFVYHKAAVFDSVAKRTLNAPGYCEYLLLGLLEKTDAQKKKLRLDDLALTCYAERNRRRRNTIDRERLETSIQWAAYGCFLDIKSHPSDPTWVQDLLSLDAYHPRILSHLDPFLEKYT